MRVFFHLWDRAMVRLSGCWASLLSLNRFDGQLRSSAFYEIMAHWSFCDFSCSTAEHRVCHRGMLVCSLSLYGKKTNQQISMSVCDGSSGHEMSDAFADGSTLWEGTPFGMCLMLTNTSITHDAPPQCCGQKHPQHCLASAVMFLSATFYKTKKVILLQGQRSLHVPLEMLTEARYKI